MSFKRFLIKSSGCPSVQWSGTIYAILVEGIMGTTHCEIILELDRWFRRCCLNKKKSQMDGWTDGHTTAKE